MRWCCHESHLLRNNLCQTRWKSKIRKKTLVPGSPMLRERCSSLRPAPPDNQHTLVTQSLTSWLNQSSHSAKLLDPSRGYATETLLGKAIHLLKLFSNAYDASVCDLGFASHMESHLQSTTSQKTQPQKLHHHPQTKHTHDPTLDITFSKKSTV